MRRVFFALLFLAGCDDLRHDQSYRANPQVSNKEECAIWFKQEAQTAQELHDEINTLVDETKCGTITPPNLRKVLHDITRLGVTK